MIALDPQTGAVALRGHRSSDGDWPRGMLIDPSGAWALVGNQWSDEVYVLPRDPETGELGKSVSEIRVPGVIAFQATAI